MATINGTSSDDSLTGTSGDDRLNGLDGPDTLYGAAGRDTLVGGLGNDTYVLIGSGVVNDTIIEQANEGTDTVLLSSSITSYTLAANVENAYAQDVSRPGLALSGNSLNNALIGSDFNDRLFGRDGEDTLNGGEGADTLSGGTGDDYYIVDNPDDQVSELNNEGHDTVDSRASRMTLASFVEDLILRAGASGALRGTGNALDNSITGNEYNNTLAGLDGNDSIFGSGGNDTISGDAGNDTLDGGSSSDVLSGGSGNDSLYGGSQNDTLSGDSGDDTLSGGGSSDSMRGGTGNDYYVVESSGDIVIEASGEGNDTIESGLASLTLSSQVENLVLSLGVASAVAGVGNGQDNRLIGNEFDNTLSGQLGNDTLDGGEGADTLIAGQGHDVYRVDSADDVVVELAGEGTDLVYSTAASYTLGDQVENLVLDGSVSTDGVGNAMNNSLQGNDADNLLDGGSGADTLAGGAGSDIYIVDHAGDQVLESSGAGQADQVYAAVSFSLNTSAAQGVENLVLTGSSAVNGSGNALDNTLEGNAADNVLDGGSGHDTMLGGAGNDTYVVDSSDDMVVEFDFPDQGDADQVRSSVSYTLDQPLSAGVEDLTLLGSGAINGSGNALDNHLNGNAAANVLSGGRGDDSYQGGGGADTLIAAYATSNNRYIWGRGEGADTVSDAGGSDALAVRSGVAADQVWLRSVGANLEISIIGTSDSFTVLGWTASARAQIETIQLAGGATLVAANVQALVDAMAMLAPPPIGQTNLTASEHAVLDPVIAANWS